MKKLEQNTQPGIRTQIDEYIVKIQEARNKHFAEHLSNLKVPIIELKVMTKYYKVMERDQSSRVFCFIDSDGNIFKPVGWSAPAPGIRGHVSNSDLPVEGGQLYRY